MLSIKANKVSKKVRKMQETEGISSVNLVNHGSVPSELNLCPSNKLVASAKSPLSQPFTLGSPGARRNFPGVRSSLDLLRGGK